MTRVSLSTNFEKGCDPEWKLRDDCGPVRLSHSFEIEVIVMYEGIGGQTSTVWGYHNFYLGEVVPDLSISKRHQKSFRLQSPSSNKPVEGKITLAFTPHAADPAEVPREENTEFADIRQLLKSVSQLPLPPGWEMKHTVDGRVFFTGTRAHHTFTTAAAYVE
ncbi:hypothetical protein CLCR_02123 [Cladophialophora carrionii]|uniref:Uncharacterized protein n=1 Tax=Cladophialophora carrionii TaxID=86049 RepID=A0A1C1CDU7_9EURO|nr:hypothetical protein CLCR_02123 [Cladophialophora carrionii]